MLTSPKRRRDWQAILVQAAEIVAAHETSSSQSYLDAIKDDVFRPGPPRCPDLASETRARRFVERHGRLVQVELDALPPDQLRRLYEGAVAAYWDESAFEAAVEREREEVARLGAASP